MVILTGSHCTTNKEKYSSMTNSSKIAQEWFLNQLSNSLNYGAKLQPHHQNEAAYQWLLDGSKSTAKPQLISLTTVNPLLSPPGGLFISSPFEVGLNRDGAHLRGRAYLFYKRQWYQRTRLQSGKAQVQEVCRSRSRGSESNPIFHLVNKPSWISSHKVLQSWLIDTVYSLTFISEE